MHFFVDDDAEGPTVNSLCWPKLIISADQGPDGSAALNYLMRATRCNVEDRPDQSHAAARDLQGALKDSNLWNWTLGMVVAYNVPHSPYETDARFAQAIEAYHRMLLNDGPHSSPLFREYAHKILLDRGEEDFDMSDPDLERQLWDSMLTESPFQNKGVKCVMNRFMAVLSTARAERPKWHARLMAYTYIAIEMDLLHGKALRGDQVAPHIVVQESAASTTTCSKRSSERTETHLRRSSGNMLLIGMFMFADRTNMVKQDIVSLVAGPVEAWHAEQSRRLRSTTESSLWIRDQLCGGFFGNMLAILRCFENIAALARCGFNIPRGDEQVRLGNGCAEDISFECEVAGYMGLLALSLVGHRIRRSLWLLMGWPARSVLVKEGGELAGRVVATLSRQFEDHTTLIGHFRHIPKVTAIINRSMFNLMCVKQHVQALVKSDWVVSPAYNSFLAESHDCAMSSQMVEEGFHVMKSCARSHSNRHSKEHTFWAALISSRVLSTRHDFDEVRARSSSSTRAPELPKEVTRPLLAQKLFTDLPGNGAPKWYSPSPVNHGACYSDLFLVKEALGFGQVDRIRDAFLSSLITAQHKIILRKKQTETAPVGPWFFGLVPVGECAIVWPATFHRSATEQAHVQWFLPDLQLLTEPAMVTILDHRQWECFSYEWWPASKQIYEWGRCANDLGGPSVKAVVEQEAPLPLLHLAARKGFWDVPLTMLRSLSTLLDINLRVGSSIFDIVWALTMGILGCSEDECLECCLQRCAQATRGECDGVLDELEKVDGAELGSFCSGGRPLGS